jgi:hypothetical protein
MNGRCFTCGRRRPNGTMADLESQVLEALPAGVECTFVRTRSYEIEPGTIRVTIEEPSPHVPTRLVRVVAWCRRNPILVIFATAWLLMQLSEVCR